MSTPAEAIRPMAAMAAAAGTSTTGARIALATTTVRTEGRRRVALATFFATSIRHRSTGNPIKSATPRLSRPKVLVPKTDSPTKRARKSTEPCPMRPDAWLTKNTNSSGVTRPMKRLALRAGSRQATRRSFSTSAPSGEEKRMRAGRPRPPPTSPRSRSPRWMRRMSAAERPMAPATATREAAA